ncbi:MAG: efflux RND transporter periplasmic adaptor subunit [Roseiarcus sp.]
MMVKTQDDIRPVELLRPSEPEPVREPEREVKHGPPARGPNRTGRRWLGFGALLILSGAVGYGAWRHYQLHTEVVATAEQTRDSIPAVLTAPVRASAPTMSVFWPGSTLAFNSADIFARASGYIFTRKVDIGDRVKQGDLLVELAVPELDDQISQNEATLNQLRAALDQAQANLKLAQVTWDRDRPLVGQGWATQQQGTVDVQTLKADDAAVSVARANVAAQENLLKTLRQDRNYALVTAPFSGVITQRNVDIGSLVQGNANTGTDMFTIMNDDVLRIQLYVPQDQAFGVAPGVEAVVRVPEMPGREFPGKVTRIADALQPGTRTLLTEVDVPNPDHALPAGVYCTVELKIPRKTPSLIVPAAAIVFNADGLSVMVVEDGVARVRRVTESRDFGTTVELSAGVKDGDQVILNPPVDLTDGHKVTVRQGPPGQLS